MNPIRNELGLWLLACALALAAAGGWLLGRMPLRTQLATLKAAHAQQLGAQASAAAQALQMAQTRGDALSAGLLQQQTRIDQLKVEKSRAITQATTGSTCLRQPALRLLSTAPGLTVASLPPATGGAVADSATTATDTHLTSWAIATGAAYETCRARLAALIEWHRTMPATPNPNPTP